MDKYFEENVGRWTTLPAGTFRDDVDHLMSLSDEVLMKQYDEMAVFWNKDRGWEYEKYSELFRGRHVLELGSGLGYDGMQYAKAVKEWTYCDINQKNLDIIDRLNTLYDCNNTSHVLMENPETQKFPLISGFFAHGVLHHVPFELAQKEFKNINKYLLSGSPVVFLMYPKERWEDSGCPSFEDFGNSTDGGCPWAEYYDEEKIMKLVGKGYKLLDIIPWGHENREFINFELEKI